MGELWCGSADREFVFKWKKCFVFKRKGLVRRVTPSAMVDGKSSGRFLERKGKESFKSISKLLSWERCLLQKKNVCKTTPAWKSAFAANQLSPTDSMHIFHNPVRGWRWACEYESTHRIIYVVFQRRRSDRVRVSPAPDLPVADWSVVMSPLRILDFVPEVLIWFFFITYVVDQLLKLFGMLDL